MGCRIAFVLSCVLSLLLTNISLHVAYIHDQHFKYRKFHSKFTLNNLMSKEEMMLLPEVIVRFVNTVNGRDIVAKALLGDNLLAVGDANGVKLPRACRTGLCGSCTCELKDPAAIQTSSNPRDGFATIRACSTKCFVPDGEQEMVVDVGRMRRMAEKDSRPDYGQQAAKETFSDPMKRFSGDWEKEFRPQWELTATSTSKLPTGQVGAGSDPSKGKACMECRGLGRMLCYNCDGVGRLPSLVRVRGVQETCQCLICMGMRSVPCAECQGKGIIRRNK